MDERVRWRIVCILNCYLNFDKKLSRNDPDVLVLKREASILTDLC